MVITRVSPEVDIAWTFFQNVAGQIILIGGAIVAAVRYLENRQNKKIDTSIKEFRNDVCAQMNQIKNALESQQKLTDLQLEYVQKAIDQLEKRTE